MSSQDEIYLGKQFFKALLPYLANAQKEILLATFKLVRSTRNGARDLNLCINALAERAQRGVKVKCLIHCPNRPTLLGAQNLRVIRSLGGSGAQVRSTGRFTSLHAKVLIVDQEILFIGSHNFSPGSCLSNFEMSLKTGRKALVYGARMAFLQVFDTLSPP